MESETGHFWEAMGASLAAFLLGVGGILRWFRSGKLMFQVVKVPSDIPSEDIRKATADSLTAPSAFCAIQLARCDSKMNIATLAMANLGNRENERHDVVLKRLDFKKKKIEELGKTLAKVETCITSIESEAKERTKQFTEVRDFMIEMKGYMRRNGQATKGKI